MRCAVRQVFFVVSVFVVAVVIALSAGMPRAEARLQDALVCLDPDIEFPVPCEDDD